MTMSPFDEVLVWTIVRERQTTTRRLLPSARRSDSGLRSWLAERLMRTAAALDHDLVRRAVAAGRC